MISASSWQTLLPAWIVPMSKLWPWSLSEIGSKCTHRIHEIGVPQNGWFIIENPIKINMDDLGIPLFLETPIFAYIYHKNQLNM